MGKAEMFRKKKSVDYIYLFIEKYKKQERKTAEN